MVAFCQSVLLKRNNDNDGFQFKQSKRSVFVLLNYLKAYDKVWQEKLLIKKHELGVPAVFLR